MKRILFLLAAVLAAMTMSAANYDLYVGGVRVTDSNKDNITGSNIKAFDTSKACKVVYDSDKQVLTLTNVRIDRTGSGNRAIQNNGIDGLKIIFDGANWLSAKDQGTIKLDKNTVIKSSGGKDGETTYIYGGSEDALCVFNGAFCAIDSANLYIEAANSDAIWADSHKEKLQIDDSHIVAVSKKSDGHAVYNFSYVGIYGNYVSLRAPIYTNALAKVGQFYQGFVQFREPSNGQFKENGDNGYFYTQTEQRYDPSVGYVLETPALVFTASITEKIPDSKFVSYIMDQDYRHGSYVYQSDLDKITELDVSDLGIADLTGIEYYRNLKTLRCNDNKLTNLDLSKNTQLTALYCGNNKLTSIDVSKNTLLATLDCNKNSLASIDLSNNTRLSWLRCDNNRLPSLDFSKNTLLSSLICSGNRLSSLDVSKNTLLSSLTCSNNQLTSLNVSGCTKLNWVTAYNNRLNGTAMTSFINSLPSVSGKCFVLLVDHSSSGEQNDFTAANAQVAKGRNCSLMHKLSADTDFRESDECTKYDLWVGGQKMSSCLPAADGVTYDNATKTLTLEDASVSSEYHYSSVPYGSGIYSRIEGLTIDVKGSNTVKAFNQGDIDDCGITLASTATIKGDGTLRLTGRCGIKGNGDLTIKGSVELTAIGTEYGLYGKGTLTVQDNVTLSASHIRDTGTPIANWTELRLLNGLAVVEPAGVKYGDKLSSDIFGNPVHNYALYDAEGNMVSGVTVVISSAKLGDVNLDGEINSADVVAIYNYIIDGEASGIDKTRADVDGDGEVGTADVVAVYNIIIGGSAN